MLIFVVCFSNFPWTSGKQIERERERMMDGEEKRREVADKGVFLGFGFSTFVTAECFS